MSETHKNVIHRFIEEAINKGNFSVLDEIVHSNYVYRSPDQELQGIENLKGLFTSYRTAFPNLNMHIDDLIIDSDKTVTRFTLTGFREGGTDKLKQVNFRQPKSKARTNPLCKVQQT